MKIHDVLKTTVEIYWQNFVLTILSIEFLQYRLHCIYMFIELAKL